MRRRMPVPGMFMTMTTTLLVWCFLWYTGFAPSARAGVQQDIVQQSPETNVAAPVVAPIPAPIPAPVPAPDAFTSKTLIPLAVTPLPLGSIKPKGWLVNELSNEATGLPGHLHDFYTYVKGSKWLGGYSEYSGLNEGFPYWFNGLVPLAYGLPDDHPEAARLREQVHSAAEYVLEHQAADGWLGPEVGWKRNAWARFPFLLGLTQLAEANATWTDRILRSILSFTTLAHVMLSDNGRGFVHSPGDPNWPSMYDWGRVRQADFMLTLQWLLEKHSSQHDLMIWDTMSMAYDTSRKWEDWYNEAVYIKEDLYRVPNQEAGGPDFAYQHGVNVAQGLKAPAVVHCFNHNASLLETMSNGVEWTMKYHGAASGTVLADERMDGMSPYSGSELCTAVEMIFSMSVLYQTTGVNRYADLAEMAAFNALPVMMTGDHWAHQYMAQPNQPYSKNLAPNSPFYNSPEWAQKFGLEPTYPCCTTNMPQGWPKVLSNSWARVGSHGGIAHVLLSPGKVTFDGGTVDCQTHYPFADTLTYIVNSSVSLDLYVRIPDWVDTAASSVSIDKTPWTVLAPDPATGPHQVSFPSLSATVIVEFAHKWDIRIQPRANDSIAIYRGQLLYAMEIESEISDTQPWDYGNSAPLEDDYAPPEVRDYTMLNTSAWNIAIDPKTLAFHSEGGEAGTSLPQQIFASRGPPVWMTGRGCEIDWPLFKGSVPGAIPPASKRKCLGEPFDVRLVPYGSAKLHMAELPTIDLG